MEDKLSKEILISKIEGAKTYREEKSDKYIHTCTYIIMTLKV